MNVSTKKISPYLVEARITLGLEELATYLKQTKDALTKEVTVEGFRKGKAPQHLAESKLSETALRAGFSQLARLAPPKLAGDATKRARHAADYRARLT